MSRSSSISENRQEAGRLRRAIGDLRARMNMPQRISVYRDMTSEALRPICDRFQRAYDHWYDDPDGVREMGPVEFSNQYGINIDDVVTFFDKLVDKE